MTCSGQNCACDTSRDALRVAAKAAGLDPTRPIKGPAGPVVVGGVVLDLEKASGEELLEAAQALALQFKDAVAKQREHLKKMFSDSTATDGFKIGVGAKEVSHGA